MSEPRSHGSLDDKIFLVLLVFFVVMTDAAGLTTIDTLAFGTATTSHVTHCAYSGKELECRGWWLDQHRHRHTGLINGTSRSDIGHDVRVRLGPDGADATRYQTLPFSIIAWMIGGNTAVIVIVTKSWRRRRRRRSAITSPATEIPPSAIQEQPDSPR